MKMENENKVKKFFEENTTRFKTRRQASKFLMHFGSVYKAEHGIPMEWGKRTLAPVSVKKD